MPVKAVLACFGQGGGVIGLVISLSTEPGPGDFLSTRESGRARLFREDRNRFRTRGLVRRRDLLDLGGEHAGLTDWNPARFLTVRQRRVTSRQRVGAVTSMFPEILMVLLVTTRDRMLDCGHWCPVP
jgi:hypothetical protein